MMISNVWPFRRSLPRTNAEEAAKRALVKQYGSLDVAVGVIMRAW